MISIEEWSDSRDFDGKGMKTADCLKTKKEKRKYLSWIDVSGHRSFPWVQMALTSLHIVDTRQQRRSNTCDRLVGAESMGGSM